MMILKTLNCTMIKNHESWWEIYLFDLLNSWSSNDVPSQNIKLLIVYIYIVLY